MQFLNELAWTFNVINTYTIEQPYLCLSIINQVYFVILTVDKNHTINFQ